METTRDFAFEANQYAVYKQCCHFDANYNANHFKGNKHRAGCVFYKGKCLYGSEDDKIFEELTTRQAYSNRFLHSWCETKDGTIVDWVINDTLKIPSSEKVEWTLDELKELGFEYKPYIHEKGILKKINKTHKCKLKKNEKAWYKPKWDAMCGFEYSCSCVWSQVYWRSQRL